MNEIVQMVAQRTGISEDKARQAVEIVVEHLRNRLPAGVSSHLDSLLQGGSSQQANSSGIAGEIGNLLGKKSA